MQKIKDRAQECLGVRGDGLAESDKMEDSTRRDAFAGITLHFGNVVRSVSKCPIRFMPNIRHSVPAFRLRASADLNPPNLVTRA